MRADYPAEYHKNIDPLEFQFMKFRGLSPGNSMNFTGRNFCDMLLCAIHRIAQDIVPEIAKQFLGAKRDHTGKKHRA